jgi:hypothetical protein
MEMTITNSTNASVPINRVFSPHPRDDQKYFLGQIQNGDWTFMNPTDGSVENPRLLYPYTYSQVEKTEPINSISLFELSGPGNAPLFAPGAVITTEERNTIINQLNDSAMAYERRHKRNLPGAYVNPRTPGGRHFLRNIEIWKAQIKHKFRACGFWRLDAVNQTFAQVVNYFKQEEHDKSVAPVYIGLEVVNNVWVEETGKQPAVEERCGFQASVRFFADPSEKETNNRILVSPKMIPTVTTNPRDTLLILDYHCGFVTFNPEINSETHVLPRLPTGIQLHIHSY